MPLLKEMYGSYVTVLSMSMLYTLVVIICFIFAIPSITFGYTRKLHENKKLAYMSGINEGDNSSFTDAFGEAKKLQMSNWYFKDFIGQRKLMLPSEIFATVLLIVMLSVILGGALL